MDRMPEENQNPMALMQSLAQNINETGTMKIGDTERSLHVNNLCKALSMAQAEFGIAKKDKKVDVKQIGMRYNYADFTSIVRASRPALAKHGLSVCQPSYFADGAVVVTTMMLHDSGQFMASTIRLKVADADPKKIGSAFTYAKRYGYAGMTGVTCEEEDEDNDLEAVKTEKTAKVDAKTEPKGEKYTAIKAGSTPPKVEEPPAQQTAKPAAQAPAAQQPAQTPPPAAAAPDEVPTYVKDAREFAKVAFGPDLMRELQMGEIAKFLNGRNVGQLSAEECKAFKKLVTNRAEEIALTYWGGQRELSTLTRLVQNGGDIPF